MVDHYGGLTGTLGAVTFAAAEPVMTMATEAQDVAIAKQVRADDDISPAVRALARATDAGDRVRRLQEIGFTQKSLASMAGASERSVRNWRTTGTISVAFDERLRDVADIVLLLDGSLTPRGIVQWFNARLRYLGGQRPADVIHGGDIELVREAARAFVEGSYL
jgi:hypothetical protein